MIEWDIQRATGVCSLTGRTLAEGEEFYAVLFEDGASFRREDYSRDAWRGAPAGVFCFFRSRVPFKAQKKRLLIDDDALTDFFLRLAGEAELLRVEFRFVLALILMRKRRIKYEETIRSEGREVWRVKLVRDGLIYDVANPGLTEDRIANVSRELSAILHSDMGEFADWPREPAPLHAPPIEPA